MLGYLHGVRTRPTNKMRRNLADRPADSVRPANETHKAHRRRKHIRILGRRLPMPESVAMRRALGGLLVAGGTLGFLPVLGFWMIPLGLVVLSHDSAIVRRKRRQLEVKFGRKWRANAGKDDDSSA